MQFLIFLVLCIVGAVVAQTKGIIVNFSVPSDASGAAGLYWIGHDAIDERVSETRPWFGNSDMENLLTIISPGAEVWENVVPGSAFILRSSDFSTRARVTVTLNSNDDEDRLFSLKIVNLAMEDRNGPYPIEVKHSDGGYLWVEPAEYMEHATGENHPFEVRDRKHNPMFSISIRGHAEAGEL
jgi:hypothetical protein